MLVALLSAVLLGGVQSASCEMHGLGAARGHQAHADVMAGHSHGSVAADRTGDSGADMGGSGCDCTCIGTCTMVAPLVVAPSTPTLLVALAAPEPSRPVATEPTRAPPPAPDRLLPFANGPPGSALV